jgi:hypothetical protein
LREADGKKPAAAAAGDEADSRAERKKFAAFGLALKKEVNFIWILIFSLLKLPVLLWGCNRIG